MLWKDTILHSHFMTIGRFVKCHLWRHKNTSKSISFLGVFFPTSPLILPFKTNFMISQMTLFVSPSFCCYASFIPFGKHFRMEYPFSSWVMGPVHPHKINTLVAYTVFKFKLTFLIVSTMTYTYVTELLEANWQVFPKVPNSIL